MGFLQVAHQVSQLFRARKRRVSIGAERAHVEFRTVVDEELPALADAISTLAADMRYLDWVELNAHTQRVVFAYQRNAYGEDELVSVVERAERMASVDNAGFERQVYHPEDQELPLRRSVELFADLVALTVGASLRVTPLPAVPGVGNLVAAVSLLRSVPRLRGGLEERWGPERADLILNLANSVVHAAAQRPMTSLVDSVHKFEQLRELRGQASVWERRKAELLVHKGDGFATRGIGQSPTRPCPLPRGPIEEYADRAWAVSLSGFALSLVATRSIQRATAAVFGGLPRPARVGRDIFAAELSLALAQRGLLVQEPEVLRRFDRLNCLVLQGDLVTTDHFVLSGVTSDEPDEAADLRERVRAMFDPKQPLRSQGDGLWRLGPWGQSGASADIRLQEHARASQRTGTLLLCLERAGRAVAVVDVEIVPRTGVEELIAAAQDAQMRVVIASSDESVLDRFNVDDMISQTEGMRAGIRRLQREGHGVLVVATGDSIGLPLADCGIGIVREGEPTPWGAHIICRRDLGDVRFLIHACKQARELSKQAVNIALSAASVGALVSAGGLLKMTTRRVLFVVNSASLISMANGFRSSTELRRLQLPAPWDPTPWHALEVEGVLARLGTSRDGLGREEIVRRSESGVVRSNELAQLTEAVSDELFSPFAPLLAVGAGLSAVVGSVGDAAMVAGVVVVNALVGGTQRYRTERKIRELTEAVTPVARVRRGGFDYQVMATDLVLGDVVVLATGDVVPADCRIISGESLEVDASTLTGESLPVSKGEHASFEDSIADRSSMLYAGTSIAAGRAVAVVVALGENMEVRRGASVAKAGRAQGGVERRLRSLMDLTGPIALAAGVGVVGGGLLRGRRLDELVGSAVSLAVASVPEGLPLLATAAQLAAAERLSQRGALVRNSRSIEALGRVDTICVDKTGTLTEGRIELSSVSDGELHEFVEDVSRARRDALAAALRASGPSEGVAVDPTDVALYRAAARARLDADFGCPEWRRRSELSFESGRGYHATFGNSADGGVLSVKGAPEVVLPMCSSWRRGKSERQLGSDERYSLAVQATRIARRGLRVLAVAERVIDTEQTPEGPESLERLAFCGFLAFTDPVRPTARQALQDLAKAGVGAVMITGDHPSTAEAIATELGLLRGAEVLTGVQLAAMDDVALDLALPRIAVFARVTPAQKVRIVRALQRAGRVVAMLGDGANDAPAIRLSDVGVAIGENSTAAARGAADIVLTDGRIETLLRAVAEGRAMWSSVRDAVSILMGGNLGEIGFTTAVGVISGRPPLNARQLLLVNLLTDVAPAMAIAIRPPSEETLDALAKEGPEASLGQPLNRDIALRAGLTGLGAAGAWTIARFTGTRARASTVALASLVGTQLSQTLSAGHGDATVRWTGIGSAAVLAAIIQTPGLSHFFGCRPLGPFGWATVVGASAAATNVPRLVTLLREAAREPAEREGEESLSVEAAMPKALPAVGTA